MIDSTIIRAQQHSSEEKGAPQEQAIGRSRGGLSTKIHATVDALENSTGFHLTPGQAHDLEGADVLFNDTAAGPVLADKAYDAQARMIEPLLKTGKIVGIPLRAARCASGCARLRQAHVPGSPPS